MTHQQKSNARGFTVIELLITIIFLIAAGVVVAWQLNNLRVANRDDAQKVAINSMYYALEEVFYKEHGHYPETISNNTLRSIDPQLLVDPFGVKLGDTNSTFRYEPSKCVDGKCERYTLRADLENESDYVKNNRSHKD